MNSLAERQHGLVTRTQIVDIGLSVRSITPLRKRGDLVLVVRGLYRVGGAPRSWEQRVMAAWLASDGPKHAAVVSRETAAALHGFHSYDRRGTPKLTTPRGGSDRSRLAHVVTCGDLRNQDLVTLSPSGIVVTSTSRTVFDLALGQRNGARLDRLLDRSLLDGHTTVPDLWELLVHTQASGKRGVVKLRAALLGRSDDYVPLESELEHLAVEALGRRGVPAAVRQHPLPGAPFGRVDLAFTAAKLVVELDGRQHRAAAARRVDYERDVAAARAGWQVIRFDWFQVRFSPEWFAEAVDDVRRTRERILHGVMVPVVS